MSKKLGRPRRRQSFAWPVAAFGGVLLILAVVLFAGNAATGKSPTVAAGQGSGGGRITVDQPKIDYGYVKFGNDESFRIKVTNMGNAPLRFADQPYIEVLEGC